MFLKNKDIKNLKYFNIHLLEKRLKKAKRDKPWNAKLFNQLGNFWRIKGNAGKAIDCFRSALIMDPTNADVLHNLGRILFTLQYLDDAIFLTRRSLEAQPNARNVWQHYFTLGEIYKAYGQFQQSILHFRHALELNPNHEPIMEAIQNLEDGSPSSVQMYTIIIILLLVSSCVLSISISQFKFFFLRFCFAGYKCIGCNLIDKRFFRQLRRNSGTETAATLQSCHGHEIAQRFRSTLIEITKSKLLSECSPYTFRRLCVLS